MRIAMIGTGYVGLVSGACFTDIGHEVCCVDKDGSKIDLDNPKDMKRIAEIIKKESFDGAPTNPQRTLKSLDELSLKRAILGAALRGTPSRLLAGE